MCILYCRVPARLQQTARAATRHGARDPLVRPQVDKLDNHLDKKNLKGTNRILDSPFLLRQGEPGKSQYICSDGQKKKGKKTEKASSRSQREIGAKLIACIQTIQCSH